ncbi:hypothetical protein JC525_19595 [Alteromonas sp. IB21]|uniref:hypothetical protein n=1 Tax=Alteromonas sp. IB21 TaxID=2779369 RepID=UPI0018E7E036|nr:hypothetical protein [Alteromonas sp. IB21]MBJ2131124.1 hypothetical protein [Alteromonas sp. IB21]
MQGYRFPLAIGIMGLMFIGMAISADSVGAVVTLTVLALIFLALSGLYFWIFSQINKDQ